MIEVCLREIDKKTRKIKKIVWEEMRTVETQWKREKHPKQTQETRWRHEKVHKRNTQA